MIVTTTNRMQAPAVTVLRVAGDLDTFAADDLRAHLRRLTPDSDRAVEIDLSAVTFMSCTALGVLAEAKGRLGPRLVLGTRSRIVTRLLEITGLTTFFRTPQGPAGSPATDGDPPARIGATPATWTFSRTDLERVRGLLMGVHGCDAEEAWRMLTRAAAWQGVPVVELVDVLAGGHRNSPRTPSPAAAAAALTVLMRRPDEAALGDAGPLDDAAAPTLARVRLADT